MLTGLVVIVLLSSALCAGLLIADTLLKANDASLVDQIEGLLPKIQCAQCGFPGCRPYAEALAAGTTAANLCPPGGHKTALDLAELLAVEAIPLASGLGSATISQVAKIDESMCIGCNLCVRACPVDAIVGIPQMMHTIIGDHCTGCELCLAPCPVDCIDIQTRHA